MSVNELFLSSKNIFHDNIAINYINIENILKLFQAKYHILVCNREG